MSSKDLSVGFASMRPRELPAEDDPWRPCSRAPGSRGFNEAAGVTRGRPLRAAKRPGEPLASMRPRELPAEDVLSRQSLPHAAAASMRPRELPAEDDQAALASHVPLVRFNEAAGVTRGRRRPSRSSSGLLGSFNEAAGGTRG